MSKTTQETLNPANYPFKTIIPTRFVDVNAGNHISNIAIIQMFEDARARFYDDLGFEIVCDEFVLMIVSNTIDYFAEAHWPHDLEIYCKIENIGNSSFKVRQLAIQNGKAVASCLLTTVHTQNGRAVPINANLRDRLTIKG